MDRVRRTYGHETQQKSHIYACVAEVHCARLLLRSAHPAERVFRTAVRPVTRWPRRAWHGTTPRLSASHLLQEAPNQALQRPLSGSGLTLRLRA